MVNRLEQNDKNAGDRHGQRHSAESLDSMFEQMRAMQDEMREACEQGGEAGYERSAELLFESALLAFNTFAKMGGVTGFQADWAAMIFLAKIKGYDHPFMVVDASRLLYPQYDVFGEVKEQIAKWMTEDWLVDAAVKNIESVNPEMPPDPNVYSRWLSIAKKADKMPDNAMPLKDVKKIHDERVAAAQKEIEDRLGSEEG